MSSGWENFPSHPVFYVKVDFKKAESDMFHAGSKLLESECIKRKTRLSE